MDYIITGSNQTVQASNVPVTSYGYIVSTGESNTIYLSARVGAAPGKGTNHVYGVDDYNLLQYFNSPGPVTVDASQGLAWNGFGGIDHFSGITGYQLSSFSDAVKGSAKNEIFYLSGGSDTVDGGGGFDKVTFYTTPSTDYQVNYDLSLDRFTVSNGTDVKILTDIDQVEFGDKSFFSEKSLGVALQARYIGFWQPITTEVYTAQYTPTLANTFWGNLALGSDGREGLVATGWSYAGFDNKATTVTQVQALLIEQTASGQMQVATQKYLGDATTNGGGSVILADFNKDGQTDILLPAHNESPFVGAASTAYLSGRSTAFDKLTLNDRVMAHDAEIFQVNGEPVVLTKTFSGQDLAYRYTGGQFVTSIMSNARAAGGMSVALADLDNDGQQELVMGDVTVQAQGFDPQKFYIGIYGFSNLDASSSSPLRVLTPYMSSRAAYANVSSEWGLWNTHVYRVWTDDLNHDGLQDILAGTSMWKSGSMSYPSMLQLFQNQGKLGFEDVTDSLNPEFPVNSGEVDYTLQMRDIDGSGIKTLLAAGSNYEARERQSNFILLNDGTGHLYSYKRSEFNTYSDDLNTWALKNGYVSAVGASVKFHSYLTSQGKINFVADMSVRKLVNGQNVSQSLLIDLPLGLEPAKDFVQDITISDRNQSRLMRTWAGDDVITDVNAGVAAHLDGGLGSDTLRYSGKADDYTLSYRHAEWVVEKRTVGTLKDTLVHFEKLEFADRSVNIAAQAHGSYADVPDSLYQFFITAFGAAPGVTYMDQLAEAYRYGLSVRQIVNIFTTKKQFTDLYPVSMDTQALAAALVDRIVKSSATATAREQAAGDVRWCLDNGWSVGDVIYQVFGNLAGKSHEDPTWGATAKQFAHQVTVAKCYTDLLSQATTDLETLRDVMDVVTASTDVSSDTVVADLIGVALLQGGVL